MKLNFEGIHFFKVVKVQVLGRCSSDCQCVTQYARYSVLDEARFL